MTETSDALSALARQLTEGLRRSPADAGQRAALAAALAPALTDLKQQVAGLAADERAALFARVKDAAGGAGGGLPAAVTTLAAMLDLLPPPHFPPSGLSDGLVALYLLLWLLDQDIIAAFCARHVPFDLADPPADFWYPRTDTAGSHAFFQNGVYLTNTIPAATENKYYNAEIYNSTQTALQPKNVIVNLFPVDSPKDAAHFLYDLFLNVPFVPANGLVFEAEVKVDNLKGGSRGWGFWNTDVLPLSMQIAWFIQYEGVAKGGVKPIYENGFYAITQNGLSGLQMPSAIRLPDLDENWHKYRIAIIGGTAEYFIDGRSVAKITDPNHVPSAPMAFHDWVDNALFGVGPQGMITHILQATAAPRANSMRNLRLQGLPAAGETA